MSACLIAYVATVIASSQRVGLDIGLLSLIMLVIFPAVIGMMPGMEASPRLALLPVFNVSQLIKSIFAGDYTAAAFLVSFASNFVYAAVAFAIAVRIFQREDVLFRT